jgi:hypothetical protein
MVKCNQKEQKTGNQGTGRVNLLVYSEKGENIISVAEGGEGGEDMIPETFTGPCKLVKQLGYPKKGQISY